MLEVVGFDDGALAIARLVPGVGRIAEAAEVGHLVFPGVVAAADPM
jgi:hypothetical protein